MVRIEGRGGARYQQGYADGAVAAKADAPALIDHDHVVKLATLAANQAAETDKRMTARSRAVYSIGWYGGYTDTALQREPARAVRERIEQRKAAKARFSIVQPEG